MMLPDLKHLYVNQLIPSREGIKRPLHYCCKPMRAHSCGVSAGQQGMHLRMLLWSLVSEADVARFFPVPGQKRNISSPSEGKQ